MNSTPQPIPISAYIISVIVWLLVVYIVYRRNLRSLRACKNSQKARPNKVRFTLSWFVYSLPFYVPLIFIIWFLAKEFPTNFALAMLFMSLSSAPSAFPYYTLAIYKSKLNGATLWGWRWKRTEIAFDEIKVSKSLNQPWGKVFGIRVLYSTNGEKILTLGLVDQQILNILKSAHEIE